VLPCVRARAFSLVFKGSTMKNFTSDRTAFSRPMAAGGAWRMFPAARWYTAT
jgi:hypothetical protein